MTWETIFAKVGEAVAGKTTEIALDHHSRQGLIDKIRKLFGLLKEKNQKILVLGCAGVGKTRFIQSLFDEKALLVPVIRTEFNKKYPLIIDEMPITFIDTAGQRERQEARKKLLKAEASQIVGIINVVSYGYHNVEIDDTQPTFQGDKIEEDFLNENLIKELAYLKEWVHLTELTDINWVITLVNKADVWRLDREKVENYYASPKRAYKEEFKRLLGNDFPYHFTLPYSSVLELFYGVSPIRVGEAEQKGLQALFQAKLVELLTHDFSKP